MNRPNDNPADSAELRKLLVDELEKRRRNAKPGDKRPKEYPALELAKHLRVRPHGSRDSRKRGVRLLVEALKNEGVPILANGSGYFLPLSAANHHEYREFRRRSGLAHLIAAAADARSTAVGDAEGQLMMFADKPSTRF